MGVPIVDNGYKTICPEELNPITRNLCLWLSQYVGHKGLLEWVIRSGGCIHHELKAIILRQIQKATIPFSLKLIWQILCSDDYACYCYSSFDSYDLIAGIKSDPWNPVFPFLRV